MIQFFTAEEKWYISIIRGFTMSGDCKSKNLSRQLLAGMVADKAIGMCEILINVLILIIKTCPLIGNE